MSECWYKFCQDRLFDEQLRRRREEVLASDSSQDAAESVPPDPPVVEADPLLQVPPPSPSNDLSLLENDTDRTSEEGDSIGGSGR